MAQRDIEAGLESAVGQFVLSQSTVRELTDTLSQEDEAWRTRDRSHEAGASLFMDTVYEPLGRWGQKPGGLGGGAMCEDGRQVRLSLSTTKRESSERCLEVSRGLAKRGRQTPVTITTEGALGLTEAIEAMGPKSLRIRCWFHQRPNLQPKVPAGAWLEFKALVGDRRDAPTRAKAEERRQALVARYQHALPEACRGLLDDAAASLNPRPSYSIHRARSRRRWPRFTSSSKLTRRCIGPDAVSHATGALGIAELGFIVTPLASSLNLMALDCRPVAPEEYR